MSTTPDEPLDEQPPTYTYPFGPLFHGLFDRLWRAVASLQRREADTFDSILVKNALEIRGGQATLVLSPEEQSGAYSALTISRQHTGSLSIELTEYSEDHSHSTATILLQVNLNSRKVFLGKAASFPLDADAVPTISGVLDDPNSPPASAAAVQQILVALAANGLLKNATTMAPAEGAA